MKKIQTIDALEKAKIIKEILESNYNIEYESKYPTLYNFMLRTEEYSEEPFGIEPEFLEDKLFY